MSVTLLPCPFCGGKARFLRAMDESLWNHNTVPWTSIHCDECESQTSGVCEGEERSAEEIWNRRAGQQPAGWRLDRSSCLDGDECFVISGDPMACGEYVYRSIQPVVYAFLDAIASARE